MSVSKSELRKRYLELRLIYDKNILTHKSKLIFEKIINHELFISYNDIMLYYGHKNEVSTDELIKHCLQNQKNVMLPKIIENEIIPFQINDYKNITKGSFGIYEPNTEASVIREPLDIQVIFIPGITFDRHKNRIGYGGGYYDRFLKRLSNDCLKVGLSYDFQIAPNIPSDIFDIKMDMIITDKEIIY